MKIYFDEQKHSYTDDDRNVYTSVSKVVAKNFPKFPKETIAQKVADKEGRTQQEVIAEWDAKGELAVMKGNLVHRTIELHLEGILPQKTALIEDIESKLPKGEYLCEKILADKEHLIAGTADLLIRNGDDIKIIDWKTNNDLYKYKTFQKYTMQLNLYRYMVEKQGKTVSEMKIFWIKDDIAEVVDVPRIDVEPLLKA